MRYVLMTYHSPEHAEAWERSTAEEKRLEIERTMTWFRAQHEAGRIVGGEELGRARAAKVVRAGGVSDGPFVETKEQLGGFIVLEVPGRSDRVDDRGRMARAHLAGRRGRGQAGRRFGRRG